MSSLPGMPFPRSAPLFLPRHAFCDYLLHYVAAFDLPIETGAAVSRLARSDGVWTLSTPSGVYSAESVVLATAIVANPKRPRVSGEARFARPIAHNRTHPRPRPPLQRRGSAARPGAA